MRCATSTRAGLASQAIRALAALIVLLAIGLLSLPARADTRVALVIGNGNYKNTNRLANPPNDATDIAAALTRDGFEIILGLDLDRAGMEDAQIRFSRKAREADAAIVYYSGHAIQYAGTNYLLPIDATLNDATDLRRLIKVDGIVDDLQQAKTLRVLILDSCRDNPLADELKRALGSSRGASVQRGLARLGDSQGMIVAYSTSAGQTADDGTGRNSPYTTALLRHIETSEEITTVFKRTAAEVVRSGRQRPELSLTMFDEYYLNPPAKAVAAPVSAGNESKATLPKVVPPQQAASAESKPADQKVVSTLTIKPEIVEQPNKGKILDRLVPTAPSVTAAQRVVLYDEDPSNPKGKQYVGTVTWRTEPVKGNGGKSDDISVRADIDVPDRKFKMTMSFRRNNDTSLPASHLAELTFILPPDFAGGGVANVPGILVKSNEQARGTPLAGLAVKVTDGFFLVGLSDVETDRVHNLQLLKERGWFDVPLVYANQRRAIIAIEKGSPGTQAYAEAFAAWGQ